MQVTGHKTAAMVRLYTEGAEQRLRATQAIERMEIFTDSGLLPKSDAKSPNKGSHPDQLNPLKKMVPRDGIEPPTRGFSVPCSTN